MTVICLCWCTCATTIAQTPAEEEALLKVGFIYNFSKLTRWPENTWLKDDAPLILCTVGHDALANAVKGLVGKVVKGHTLSIKPLERLQYSRNCHVLYVAFSEQRRFEDIVNAIRGKPVLSISEISGFAQVGGIIELVKEEGRIRFKINLDAARENELELSSRLLSLALVISHEAAP